MPLASLLWLPIVVYFLWRAGKYLKRSSQSDQPPNLAIGCEVLSKGSNPVADIVFVHGLCGHQTNTWTKNDVCWPKDLLPKEEGLSNTRIIAFGYDGNIVGFSSQNSISEHSRSLLNGLVRARGRNVDRPLIFVAHSIGGLVVKKMLQLSYMEKQIDPALANILKATKGLIFIGTPHRGSDDNAWKNMIGNVATAVSDTSIKSTLLDELKRNSPTLDDMGTDFSRIDFMTQFRIFSFYEELPMQTLKGRSYMVVEKDSAVIGGAKERRDSIHANHIDIVRFDSIMSPGYDAIVFAIKEVVPQSLSVQNAQEEELEESIT